MQGRGSATRDELIAATYVASQLRQYGIEPAGDNGSYIQRASTIPRKITASPTLVLTIPGSASPSWVYGKEFIAVYLSRTEFGGPLQKITVGDTATSIKAGAVVVISGKDDEQIQRAAFAAARKGAAAEVIVASPKSEQKFADAAKQMPSFPLRLEKDDESSPKFNVLQLSTEAFQALQNMPEGAVLNFKAASEDEKGWTWNAVGILKGRDPALQHSAVLLSAHLDHLGVGEAVNDDAIYNGADDDASGPLPFWNLRAL